MGTSSEDVGSTWAATVPVLPGTCAALTKATLEAVAVPTEVAVPLPKSPSLSSLIPELKKRVLEGPAAPPLPKDRP